MAWPFDSPELTYKKFVRACTKYDWASALSMVDTDQLSAVSTPIGTIELAEFLRYFERISELPEGLRRNEIAVEFVERGGTLIVYCLAIMETPVRVTSVTEVIFGADGRIVQLNILYSRWDFGAALFEQPSGT